jgi:hypothetical protein
VTVAQEITTMARSYSPAPISLIIERERLGDLNGSAVLPLIRNSSRALESGLV